MTNATPLAPGQAETAMAAIRLAIRRNQECSRRFDPLSAVVRKALHEQERYRDYPSLAQHVFNSSDIEQMGEGGVRRASTGLGFPDEDGGEQ